MIRERAMWIALLVLSAGLTILLCLTLPAILGATLSAGDVPAAVIPLSFGLCVVAVAVHVALIVRVARSRG